MVGVPGSIHGHRTESLLADGGGLGRLGSSRLPVAAVEAVSVGFVKIAGTAGLTYTRTEGRYRWPVTRLVGEPRSERGS
jgi:hypothetical protein